MPTKELGLFGYGRLGRLLAEQLSSDFSIAVFDPAFSGQTDRGQSFVDLSEAAKKEIVLLAVPMSAMETTCRQIAAFLRPGQLLLDTCSVKIVPMQIMERWIPKGVEIIGTHPLFGPDSAKSGLGGHKIVLCPLSDSQLPRLRRFLKKKGLQVIIATPEAHDRAMAETQCLFHLMARAIQEMGIKVGDITTPGPEKLYRDFSILQHDTLQLFRDMQRLNPYASQLRRQFIDILEQFDADLR
jgi:prephenate dehydrogenase